jgi:hypothetical protein
MLDLEFLGVALEVIVGRYGRITTVAKVSRARTPLTPSWSQSVTNGQGSATPTDGTAPGAATDGTGSIMDGTGDGVGSVA